MNDDLKDILDREVLRYNCPEFIPEDPVQFPRMFTDKRDVEIASLLVSSIAWGKRSMILANSNKMLAMMDWQPWKFVMDEAYEDLPDGNIHRTFFAADMRHYLRGLHAIYKKYDSLEDFASALGVADACAPAWELAAGINRVLADANGGENDCRCLPLGLDTSALKRFNMALRWLVRNDGVVDLGVWSVLKPSQLYIPLDVHVGNVSRAYGLLSRRSNDRKAVEELTSTLRTFCADDPVKYDFALFSLGVNARSLTTD